MEPRFTVNVEPKTGYRTDFTVLVDGPGESHYVVPITVSGTALRVWKYRDGDLPPETIALKLAQNIFAVIGTSKAPPGSGFSFDSYNSGLSIKETVDKIRNFGIAPFSRAETFGTGLQAFFGDQMFNEIEKTDSFFVEKFGRKLFRSFEDAFEDSRVRQDLSSFPKDHANFLYRVCALSVIIDHLDVRLSSEKTDGGSLVAFERWLATKVSATEAHDILQPFYMVKKLRKQYPIHEHYQIKADGIKEERAEITEAKRYFGLRYDQDDHEGNWSKTVKKFISVFTVLREKIK